MEVLLITSKLRGRWPSISLWQGSQVTLKSVFGILASFYPENRQCICSHKGENRTCNSGKFRKQWCGTLWCVLQNSFSLLMALHSLCSFQLTCISTSEIWGLTELLFHPLLLLLLLSHFSCVQLCATPETAAHQAPPSLGFSRQEHWSGLPFPSPMHESESESEVAQLCQTLSDPMNCSPPGSFVHGIFQARVLEWGAIAFSIPSLKQCFPSCLVPEYYCMFGGAN